MKFDTLSYILIVNQENKIVRAGALKPPGGTYHPRGVNLQYEYFLRELFNTYKTNG